MKKYDRAGQATDDNIMCDSCTLDAGITKATNAHSENQIPLVFQS